MKRRAFIQFHAKLTKNASETFWLMQQAYGDDCLSRSNVFLWHKPLVEKAHDLFVPNGQTITGAYYHEFLNRLMARIRRIRPEYCDLETWSLLHDIMHRITPHSFF